MAFSKITYRRRRRRGLRGEPLEQRRGFWKKLRSPNTLKLIISVGFMIYRIFRYALKFRQFFE
jgi:hypothetical protein